ncbi:hypothetical protein HHK36_019515 [Tetracentron sinense]|uniref:Gnk2-homologous domain-containing protein n=1 Tax=Tetracentron sinense TaxID=13715 RepID=A0A834YXN0_TETSI|nr:hypothetical protein HHK36_019515 [Tetracentron sinense]
MLRGSPPWTQKRQQEVAFRMLCSTDKVGGVIGKGGTIVRALEIETDTSISVGDPVAESDDSALERSHSFLLARTQFITEKMQSFVSEAVHLLLFSCLLLLQSPIKAQTPIYISCNTSSAYTSGTNYNSNLNLTLTSLAAKASLTGFYAATVGKHPDGVYGLVQCKGDISKEDCKTCASTSVTEIGRRCHNLKEAAIGYDNCWLWYSDKHVFSRVNDVRRAVLSSVQSVSDPVIFNGHLVDLMNNLSSKAASTSSRFTTGKSEFMDIYSMVQCTRDLSENSCLRCLKEMIGYFPRCCDGKEGGRVISLSCNVRYEKYSFFQSSSQSLPPPASVAASPLLSLLDGTISIGRDGLPFRVRLSEADNSDANPILQTYCGDSANYTSGSPFETNLNRLLPILLDNGPRTGFYKATFGNGFDKAYGLVQCRGDISFKDCQDCLEIAKSQILIRCPKRTRVVIGYEFCLLRFANQTFFSEPDLRRIIPYWNDVRVVDPELFKQRLGILMSNLSHTAAYDSTKFAVGIIDSNFTQIYGLAQCTRDLSDNDCLRCIQALINIIPSCCDGRQGARILSPTCNIRYEIKPFVQTTPIPQVFIEGSTVRD